MARSDGKAGVVRDLVRSARGEYDAMKAAAEGEQIALFPPPTRFHGPRAVAAAAAIERRGQVGRPPGLQNLTSREFREWLFGRGISPLVSLMRYAIMPPDLLAAELGCTRLEAFREWRILQTELAPYMHARMAFVDDEGKPVPVLQMLVAGRQVTVQSGMTPWEMREQIAKQIEGNQPLSEVAVGGSHAAQSHGEDK